MVPTISQIFLISTMETLAARFYSDKQIPSNPSSKEIPLIQTPTDLGVTSHQEKLAPSSWIRHVIKRLYWDWKNDSAVKSTCCSCWEPGPYVTQFITTFNSSFRKYNTVVGHPWTFVSPPTHIHSDLFTYLLLTSKSPADVSSCLAR